jgi:hypothetical protein
MDDICSIIVSAVPLINKKMRYEYFKNINLICAYKWAKVYVEFDDYRLHSLLSLYPELSVNIAQYAVIYEKDDLLRNLCDQKLIDFDIHEGMLFQILRGNFPKTCEYIAKNKIFMNVQDYSDWSGIGVFIKISKLNILVFANYFAILINANKGLVFMNMIKYGFIKKAIKVYNSSHFDAGIIHEYDNYSVENTPGYIKAMPFLLKIYQNDAHTLDRIFRYGDMKVLKLALTNPITPSFFSRTGTQNSPDVYLRLFTNPNRLFIMETIIKKYPQIDFLELTKQAILIDYYPAVYSILLMKKLTPSDKAQAFNHALHLRNTSSNHEIIRLLLKDSKLDLTQVNLMLDQITSLELIKILFADPRINTPENRALVYANADFSKKELDLVIPKIN